MAIVFISPKKKHGVIIWIVVLALMLFLVAVFWIVLLPEFLNKDQGTSQIIVPGQPLAIINTDVLSSNKVAGLQPFVDVPAEFTYVVEDIKGKQITGNIPAATQDEAKTLLESAGYKVISIQEMATGRSEPFVSY